MSRWTKLIIIPLTLLILASAATAAKAAEPRSVNPSELDIAVDLPELTTRMSSEASIMDRRYDTIQVLEYKSGNELLAIRLQAATAKGAIEPRFRHLKDLIEAFFKEGGWRLGSEGKAVAPYGKVKY